MALALKFDISCDGCDTLLFTELTGEYSVSNTTGWNDASTALIADITAATLDITYPDGSVLETPIDLYPAIPTIDTTLEVEITNTDVGLTTNFPDGLYTFLYTATNGNTDPETVYTKSCNVFLTCNAECCVGKLYARVTTTDCRDCRNSNLSFAIEADGFLEAAKNAARCGDSSKATQLLEKVQYMCNLVRCNCS